MSCPTDALSLLTGLGLTPTEANTLCSSLNREAVELQERTESIAAGLNSAWLVGLGIVL